MTKWQEFKIIHDGLCVLKYWHIFLITIILIAMIVMPFCFDFNNLDIGSRIVLAMFFIIGVITPIPLCSIYFGEVIVPYRDFLVLKKIKGITAYAFIELVNYNASEEAKERKRIEEKEKVEKIKEKVAKIERKYALKA